MDKKRHEKIAIKVGAAIADMRCASPNPTAPPAAAHPPTNMPERPAEFLAFDRNEKYMTNEMGPKPKTMKNKFSKPLSK